MVSFKKYRNRNRRVRRYKRRFSRWSSPTKTKQFIHYFKRTYKQTVDVVGNANAFIPVLTSSAGGYNRFRLSDCPNYTDFTNMYDSYRICGIKRKYIFNANVRETNVAAYGLPRLITCNDFNDASAPTNEGEMLEYSSCKTSRLDRITKRYFKPSTTIEDAVQGNFQVQKRQWFDCATGADQNHHGLKEAVIVDSTNSEERIGYLHIYTTLYIACRSPR